MANEEKGAKLKELYEQLPKENESPLLVERRLRLGTVDGRTVFAFERADCGPFGFAGWEAPAKLETDDEGELVEPKWKYFVIAARTPQEPLQVISQDGPIGVLDTMELEDRPAEDRPAEGEPN
ncbi:MAG: hypothetical protein ACJ79R_04640 [Anaeromyxobacteraceae bacterium]